MRKLATFLVPVAAVSLTLAACGSSKKSTGDNGSTTGKTQAGFTGIPSTVPNVTPVDKLTVALEQPPSNFNVLTTDGAAFETTTVEEGVFPFTYRGQVDVSVDYDHNLLASEPRVVSTDPQVIEYKINPNAKWSDGVPIDVEDFKYIWTTNNGSDTSCDSASISGYQDISKIEGSDAGKTVTVTYKKVYSDWKGLFSPIYPAHLLASQGCKGFNSALVNGLAVDGKPISGGPYIQASYKTGDNLVLEPNPSYFGPAPKVKSVVFRFIADTTQFPTGMQNGEIDIANPQPTADEVAQYKQIPRIQTDLYPNVTFEHIDFNFKNEFLSDKVVRQAIATAIDQKAIIAGTVGQFAPDTEPLGNHILLNNQKGYVDNRQANGHNYGAGDVDAAKKLLEGDGWVLTDGIYTKGGKKLSLGITAKNGNPTRVTEEEIMQAELKKAGIDLQIKNTDKSIGDFTAQHDFDIALYAWVGTPFLSQNEPIYETPPTDPKTGQLQNTYNTQFYSSPQVDSLFKQVTSELDPTKQIDLYNQIDRQIFDDMATMTLFQKAGFLAFPKSIANIFPNPTTDGFSYNIGDWGGIPTKS